MLFFSFFLFPFLFLLDRRLRGGDVIRSITDIENEIIYSLVTPPLHPCQRFDQLVLSCMVSITLFALV